MKTTRTTYQKGINLTVTLLLMVMMVPSGLHAKQLVDLCMNHSETAEMSADHNCCENSTETEHQTNTHQAHDDCDGGFICECNIGERKLSDEEWIIATNNVAIQITETDDLKLFNPSVEPIHRDQQNRIGQHDPPLWLLYDTFLI